MRIFKNKRFSKFAKKESITDVQLLEVIREVEAGLIDADLGGGVIKQRIARPNEGKSGGYRSIILYRNGERAFFVFGFAKNVQANIDASDKRELKALAKIMLPASETVLAAMLKNRDLEEINHE